MTDQEFETLLLNHSKFIDSCVLKILKRKDEDVKQEVYYKAWKNRKRFDGTYFRAWLYTIARNYIFDQHRKAKRRKDIASLEYRDDLENSFANFSCKFDDEMKLDDAIKMMNTLHPKVYDVLSYTMVGYKSREIAEILTLPEGTVKSYQFRARMRMQELRKKVK